MKMRLTREEARLVVHALRFMASNLAQDDLEVLGLLDTDSADEDEEDRIAQHAGQISADLLNLAERLARH